MTAEMVAPAWMHEQITVEEYESWSEEQCVGIEIVGPHTSAATMRMLDFARANRFPYSWHDTALADESAAAALIEGLDSASLPLVRLPGGLELRGPTTGQVSRALGIGFIAVGAVFIASSVIAHWPARVG